uniref:Dirigent protein n=1 Tax=Mesocestoides corti TaxID=53468 RepID=A0A0R3U946_MESCO
LSNTGEDQTKQREPLIHPPVAFLKTQFFGKRFDSRGLIEGRFNGGILCVDSLSSADREEHATGAFIYLVNRSELGLQASGKPSHVDGPYCPPKPGVPSSVSSQSLRV